MVGKKHGQCRWKQDKDIWTSWKGALKIKSGREEAASHATCDINIVRGIRICMLKHASGVWGIEKLVVRGKGN